MEVCQEFSAHKQLILEPIKLAACLISRLASSYSPVYFITPPTPWGAGERLLPLRKNRPSVALTDHRRRWQGGPALSKWSFGFDSQLILGSTRVKVQPKWSQALIPSCPNSVTLFISQIWSPKTEQVQTCSRLWLNMSKLVFVVKMTLAVGMG